MMIDPVILAGMLESGRTYKTYEVRDMINECPRIDAVPVVRCGQCRWSSAADCLAHSTLYWCGRMRVHMYEDNFCCYGEREATT